MTTLPADDRLAQLTRAVWNQGAAIRVPDGVRLDRPIVVRWRRRRGPGAYETESSSLARVQRPRSSRSSTRRRVPRPTARRRCSPRLSRSGWARSGACRREPPGLPANGSPSSIGTRPSGRRHLHWALAQLGGRLVRSRVENLLVGDRSSVEQVEIVFGGERAAIRPDLVHAPHRPRYDRRPALEGRAPRCARSYIKGMITIEKSAMAPTASLASSA